MSQHEVASSQLVHERLILQVEALALHDAGARSESDVAIYKMRTACRRLRAVLTTFRPVFDPVRTEPIREELRWLAGVLGAARDEVLVRENLRELIESLPPEQVHGPVRERLLTTYGDRAMPELRDALTSTRYVALRRSLDTLVLDPPWSASAADPVDELAPRLLRKELRRFGRRTRAAAGAEHVTDGLHEARKVAKRLRFAAETLRPVAGKPARRLAREATQVSSELGELQDVAVSRRRLREFAAAAAGAGEPTGTYDLLQAHLEEAEARLIASFRASEALSRLDSRCHDVILELTGATHERPQPS